MTPKKYLQLKLQVLEQEIRDLCSERRFDDLEDAFYSYGLALERADSTV